MISLLALSLACDAEDNPATPESSEPEESLASAPKPRAAQTPVQELEGSIELPAAVPADSAAVFAVRVPSSMFESVIAADPMGVATDGMQDLKTDLDAFFAKNVGIQILDATAITGFARGEKEFGILIEGVAGGIKSEQLGEHAGVPLHGDKADPFRMAHQGDTLIVGTEETVKASLDAIKDPSKSAAGGEFAKFVAAQSHGAAVVIAADITRLPETVTKEVPPTMAVDRGLITFGSAGLKVRIEGDKEKIEALAGVITSGLAMASSQAEKQRERALERADDVAEGAAMIIGAHYMRAMKTALEPKLDGGTLTIEVPMKAGDPAILAAVAGIGSAIAIPAFTKYMRRSKTSEARVQLAKMFDAASSYFNEEHVERAAGIDPSAALDNAPHGCPNNGKLSGQSGITPPLSVDCSEGPEGRCVPTSDGSKKAGHYDLSLWTDNDVWNGLNFQQEQGHYFHYNFIWSNDAEGFGACQFTAQAFGDLDGDGVFSTFERAGAGDEYGINGAAGLYIHQELE